MNNVLNSADAYTTPEILVDNPEVIRAKAYVSRTAQVVQRIAGLEEFSTDQLAKEGYDRRAVYRAVRQHGGFVKQQSGLYTKVNGN